MIKLKKKIKIIDSLPPEKKKQKSIISILTILIITLLFFASIYFIYNKIKPYILATNINNITGKKISINECNTKDYIIINKDKSS